jgi:hypothetical protein
MILYFERVGISIDTLFSEHEKKRSEIIKYSFFISNYKLRKLFKY